MVGARRTTIPAIFDGFAVPTAAVAVESVPIVADLVGVLGAIAASFAVASGGRTRMVGLNRRTGVIAPVLSVAVTVVTNFVAFDLAVAAKSTPLSGYWANPTGLYFRAVCRAAVTVGLVSIVT